MSHLESKRCEYVVYKYIIEYQISIPALPKDIGNEHVRIKDILYLKFLFYHIAIPSLHYIFWNAYEGYKTPRSKKLQRRRIYSS